MLLDGRIRRSRLSIKFVLCFTPSLSVAERSGIQPVCTAWMVPWRQEYIQYGVRYVSAQSYHVSCSRACGHRDTDNSVSTLRSAIELKQVFDRLQQAEQSGMSPEAMRKLEEQAAEQGMRTLWKVSGELTSSLASALAPVDSGQR